jgi:signal transduction histidine kinase
VDQNAYGLSSEQFQANRFDIVSRLADDLAHEIKNPLNAIIINLEVLKVRIARADAEGAADRAGVIEQEVRRLHQLIDRMLMLIRPERAEASNLPVDSALDEILPLVEAQARLARNEFQAECAATVFVPVRRDVFKFALLNVLMAVHARLGEGGGVLRLDCSAGTRDVRIHIAAIPTDGASLVAGAQDGIREAAAIARALLAPAGAQFAPADDSVTVVIPRAASM